MPDTIKIAIITASAALLASLITAGASLGVVWLQERRRAKAAQRDGILYCGAGDAHEGPHND